jgi:hypothetical protein
MENVFSNPWIRIAVEQIWEYAAQIADNGCEAGNGSGG